MTECQEVGCTRPATKDWQGMKVCHDHYDKYKQQYESMMKDFW